MSIYWAFSLSIAYCYWNIFIMMDEYIWRLRIWMRWIHISIYIYGLNWSLWPFTISVFLLFHLRAIHIKSKEDQIIYRCTVHAYVYLDNPICKSLHIMFMLAQRTNYCLDSVYIGMDSECMNVNMYPVRYIKHTSLFWPINYHRISIVQFGSN